MSNYIGVYYLHQNGSLIYKSGTDCVADIRDSDFAVGLWFIDTQQRSSMWQLLVEALSAGANKERVFELAGKWFADDIDAEFYIRYHLNIKGEKTSNNTFKVFLPDVEGVDETITGFGDTYLEALADLCTKLGYKPAKMWGTDFQTLVSQKITKKVG